jgi:hypothetical protein
LENNETAKYEPKNSQYTDISYNKYAPSKSDIFYKKNDFNYKAKESDYYKFNNDIKKDTK